MYRKDPHGVEAKCMEEHGTVHVMVDGRRPARARPLLNADAWLASQLSIPARSGRLVGE